MSIPTRTADEIRKFQLTNLNGNNNKWYTLEWWNAEQVVRISYGRVGQECSRPATKTGINQRKFDKLVADRLKPKDEGTYKEVKTGVKVPTTAIITTGDSIVDNRILKIFDAANESVTSFLNTRVEDLSPEQIAEGTKQLNVVVNNFLQFEAAKGKKIDEARDSLITEAQKYFELIPTKLPHKIKAFDVAVDLAKNADEHEDRLKQLAAALTSLNQQKSGLDIRQQLGCDIRKASDADYEKVAKYILDTRRHSGYGSVKVKEVFEIFIQKEREAFENEKRGNSRIEFLFHGTRAANIRHVVKGTGLIIPNYAANGSLMGRGIYFANVSTKSLNYASPHGSERYLLLADVKVGNPYTPDSYLDWTDIPSHLSQYESVWAKANRPLRGSWGGSLAYDEIIVYRPSQQTIKYLAVVE